MKVYKIILNKNNKQNMNNFDVNKDYINKYPVRYRSEFIYEGIVNYDDLELGDVFVGNETLKRMNPTFIGKPVININHIHLTAHEAFKLTDEDKANVADGVVYEVGQLDNGNFYCDFIVWDLETQKNIDEKGFSSSCAYIVTEVASNGFYKGQPYDEEVDNGVYTHLTVTDIPRYKNAKVYRLPTTYVNSVSNDILNIYNTKQGEESMFKLKSAIFAHLFNNDKNKKTVVNQDPNSDPNKKDTSVGDNMNNAVEGSVIQLEDGTQIPLEEAVALYKASKQNQTQVLSPEDMVDLGDGNKVKVAELISACTSNSTNSEPATDDNAEPPVMENKSKKVVNNTAKQPTSTQTKKVNHFTVLKNAISEIVSKPTIHTKYDGYRLGKERYGSSKGGSNE